MSPKCDCQLTVLNYDFKLSFPMGMSGPKVLFYRYICTTSLNKTPDLMAKQSHTS